MIRLREIFGLVASVTFTAACASSRAGRDDRPDAGTLFPSGIPGYEHTFAKSKFLLGSLAEHLEDSGVEQYVGSDGVFAIEQVSRAAIATPSYDLLATQPNYSLSDAAAQIAETVAYLTDAGLPIDQISSTHTNSVSVALLAGASPLTLASGDFAILERSFRGVAIPDSVAWAMMDLRGNSLEEFVFWPALDQSLVQEIASFRAMLDESDARSAYFSKLPTGVSEGSLVIRHTSWSWQAPIVARVGYRVRFGAGALDFDSTGMLMMLPDDPSATQQGSDDGGLDSGVVDAQAKQECPIEQGVVADLPRGDCTGLFECVLKVHADCDSGARYVPAGDVVFRCRCINQWTCDPISGGTGLVSCQTDAG